MFLNDTITAVATPPGEGGIGIVRISGPSAFTIADRIFICRPGKPSILSGNTVHYGVIRDPITEERVDDALLLLFRKPRSYTGEDTVEFSCHGGPITLRRVLLLTLSEGARMAEPGEFTQRAFLNGKMDLASAEAVCDQIHARTEAAHKIARMQREGGLSREVEKLRHELIGALAAVEVTLDFSEDVGDLDYDALHVQIAALQEQIRRLLATASRGRIYREGARLAIVGRPNVGKSSLMNAILRENRAIVTPIAGTTRDVIEESASVKGIPITAIDTAGLRDTEDLVERIGVERAGAALDTATLALFVLDAEEGWTMEDDVIADRLEGLTAVWTLNKCDQISMVQRIALLREIQARDDVTIVIPISALSGEGMYELEEAIASTLLQGSGDAVQGVLVASARHQNALEEAQVSLAEAIRTVEARLPEDFISIDLRGALDSLGKITGETATEEIIHRIFHDFCVGK